MLLLEWKFIKLLSKVEAKIFTLTLSRGYIEIVQ